MEGAKKVLLFEVPDTENEKALVVSSGVAQEVGAGDGVEFAPGDVNSAMQSGSGVDGLSANKKGSGGSGRGFKRVKRTQEGNKKGDQRKNVDRKRVGRRGRTWMLMGPIGCRRLVSLLRSLVMIS